MQCGQSFLSLERALSSLDLCSLLVAGVLCPQLRQLLRVQLLLLSQLVLKVSAALLKLSFQNGRFSVLSLEFIFQVQNELLNYRHIRSFVNFKTYGLGVCLRLWLIGQRESRLGKCLAPTRTAIYAQCLLGLPYLRFATRAPKYNQPIGPFRFLPATVRFIDLRSTDGLSTSRPGMPDCSSSRA